MNELLDWVEKAALENIRAHLAAADDLKKDSTTTLTVLLAGAGGALAFALKELESSAPLPFTLAFSFLAAALFVLAAFVVLKCLKVKDFPSPTNTPKNLLQKDIPFEQLRELELNNLQQRIKGVVAQNNETAKSLNRIRLLAIVLSPLVPLAVVAAALLLRAS